MVDNLISYECRHGMHKRCDRAGCTCKSPLCHTAVADEPTPIGDQVEQEQERSQVPGRTGADATWPPNPEGTQA